MCLDLAGDERECPTKRVYLFSGREWNTLTGRVTYSMGSLYNIVLYVQKHYDTLIDGDQRPPSRLHAKYSALSGRKLRARN